MKKIELILLFLIILLQLKSQDFKWEAKVESIKISGFHEILLSPGVTGKLRADYGDIRLYDHEGVEIPYILYSEKPINYKELYKEYSIISKVHHNNYTRLVIHNPKKSEINNFSLVIRNADVRKWLTLNASDDQKEWFALKEHYYFQSFYNEDKTSEIRILNFPKSNYEYYELLVYDYFDDPISILKAGYYDLTFEKGKYTETEIPKISQLDTLKQSIVSISFNSQQYIDELAFDIQGPEFYYRNAQICLAKKTKVRGVEQISYETIKSFVISSNSDNELYFSGFPATELFLIIDNYDDQPIKINRVHAFQLNHFLTADLNMKESYSLKFGNENVAPPVYDLKYFEDSIPENLPIIKTGNISNIAKIVPPKEEPFYMNPILIWIAIGIVVIILGYVSLKMMREMPKKE